MSRIPLAASGHFTSANRRPSSRRRSTCSALRAVCLLLMLTSTPAFFGQTANADKAEQPAKPDSSTSQSAEKTVEGKPVYLLEYRFQAGQTVRYKAKHVSTLKTRKQHLTERTRQEAVEEKHYRVVRVDDKGVATLEMVIDQVHMSAQFNNEKPVVFDSRQAGKTPKVYSYVAQTIGQPLARIRVNRRGEMLGSVALLKPKLQSRVSAPVPSSGRPDDAAKNFLVELPAKPIAIGDQWTDMLSVPVNLTRRLRQEIKLQRRYQLQAVKAGIAEIKVRTIIVTPVSDPGVMAQLISRAPVGVIHFDLNRGCLLSRKLTVDQTEVGIIGGDSSMHATGQYEETLVEEKPSTEESSTGVTTAGTGNSEPKSAAKPEGTIQQTGGQID